MPLPKLRNLDIYPVNLNGKHHVCLRDPEAIQEEVVVLSPPAFLIVSMLDGKAEISQLQALWAKYFGGEILTTDKIDEFLLSLDEKFLLETETFKKRYGQIIADFESAKVRPAYLSGRSYPSDTAELDKFIETFFTAKESPAKIDYGKNPAKALKGLIAPHIDYYRGHVGYAHAYKSLAESEPADVYLIFGVAHSSPPTPFILSEKDFATPFGKAEVNSGFIADLKKNAPSFRTEFEIVHRTEHSIEFQAVLLKRFIKKEFTIVPILCSSFELFTGEKSPSQVKKIEQFIQACIETIQRFDGKVCVISGSDLAHVGPRFGDKEEVGPKMIEWMESEDKKSLDHAVKTDAEEFYRSCTYDGNKRKVCGLSSVYTALRILEGSQGNLLHYGYAPDPAGGMVSFASVEFV